MKFSQRIGVTDIRDELQVKSMDDGLRNRLWNLTSDHLILDSHIKGQGRTWRSYSDSLFYYRTIWDKHLKEPVDNIPNYASRIKGNIASRFSSWEWYEVYDFIQFSGKLLQQISLGDYEAFVRRFNTIMEEEKGAYRWVEGQITPITDENEIETIETAHEKAQGQYEGVFEHLQQSLTMLSSQEDPDYRNSIKESISAVESLMNELTNSNSSSLTDALDKLELDLHGSLESALKKLYGYTSDGEGIRHFMMNKANHDFADAKYMMVICSAFINYILEKESQTE